MGGTDNTAYLFVGGVTPGNSPNPYTPNYSAIQVLPPAGAPATWSFAVAMGDLNNDGSDEVLINGVPGKKGPSNAGVFVFRYSSGTLTLVQQFQNPTVASGGFGNAMAVANVDGSTGNELIVGDPGNGTVFIFPYPAQQTTYYSLTGPGPNFGRKLGVGDMNSDGVS